jgi:hypothetical protein
MKKKTERRHSESEMRARKKFVRENENALFYLEEPNGK